MDPVYRLHGFEFDFLGNLYFVVSFLARKGQVQDNYNGFNSIINYHSDDSSSRARLAEYDIHFVEKFIHGFGKRK